MHGRHGQRDNILGWLALNLLLQERYDEAEPLVRQDRGGLEKRLPDDSRVLLLGERVTGQCSSASKGTPRPNLSCCKATQGMKQREAIYAW